MTINLQVEECTTFNLTNDFAKWSKTEFKLTKVPSQIAINKILKKYKKYKAMNQDLF